MKSRKIVQNKKESDKIHTKPKNNVSAHNLTAHDWMEVLLGQPYEIDLTSIYKPSLKWYFNNFKSTNLTT